MKRDLPPLPWLRAFEAAARHLSFTQAAVELNLTQAAISKQVKLLEQYLREPLFIRKTRSLQLTKSGAAYVPKLRDAFERMQAGTQEVFGTRRSGALNIRANSSFAIAWLAPRLGRFFEEHPNFPLRIINSVWSDDFDRSRIDLDIQYGTGTWVGYQADRLTWDTLTPVCSAATAATLHTPRDLEDQRLLHVLGYEEGWAIWLKAADVPDLSPDYEAQLDTSLMAFQLAASGLGIALGRRSLLSNDLETRRLVKPFELEIEAQEAFYLLSPLNEDPYSKAVIFREWLKTEIANEVP